MKNIVLTFALTSLVFTASLLYCFASGKISRPEANYLDVMQGK